MLELDASYLYSTSRHVYLLDDPIILFPAAKMYDSQSNLFGSPYFLPSFVCQGRGIDQAPFKQDVFGHVMVLTAPRSLWGTTKQL